MEFFMPMRPPTVTHQEKKITVVNGKPVVYEPPELKAARAKFRDHLAQYRPVKPLEGAVRLMVKWCFPRRRPYLEGEYRITRPDTDNLQKLLKDCMTVCGYWADDAQVCSEVVEKFWSDKPGIFVSVMEIPKCGSR